MPEKWFIKRVTDGLAHLFCVDFGPGLEAVRIYTEAEHAKVESDPACWRCFSKDWREMNDLTRFEREQIAEILSRRANDIAHHLDELLRNKDIPGVEMACTREIERLRRLAGRVNSAMPEIGGQA